LSGRNAPYFQLRDRGASVEEAKSVARKESDQEIFPIEGGSFAGLSVAAKVWKTWALVLVYFTTFGGFIALTAWFPTYWTRYFGVGLGTAGALTALYSMGASLIRVYGGVTADRLGGENTMIGSLLVTVVGALILTLSNSYALSIAGAVLLAAGMGTANAAVFKLVPQEVPEAVGGAAGWVGGLGAFGGFAIPPTMGLFVGLQGAAGYATGFATFIVLGLGSLALGLVLRRSRTPARVAATAGSGAGR
jgi:NNP family nitrate/nitrite transporter-like MFS transporter